MRQLMSVGRIRSLLIPLTIFLFCFSVQEAVAEELVAKNSIWRYWDSGSGIPSNWADNGFNDNSWSSGPAQLGYGDGDEATVVGYGGNASNKYTTTYFRHTFNVVNAAAFSDLSIELLRDDGAVIYINGVEVLRDNMPAGAIDFSTFSASTVDGGNEDAYFSHTIANSLVNGTNTIAVEIHQRSLGSSDISFDLELVGNSGASSGPNFIQASATWKYWDTGSGIPGSWATTGYDDSAWPQGVAELGYGDGDEVTVVGYGGNANDKYITTYFRHTINITDPSGYADLTLTLKRDDGAVVYINGAEVVRDNMPGGSVNYNTLASSAIGGADESTFYSFTIPNTLVTGLNVIAVEVHQNNNTSSDQSFDLTLTGNSAAAVNYIDFGDSWKYLDNGSDQGTAWQAPGFNDAGWSSGNAELGYGDGDETTVVGYGGNSNNKYVTTYFRKTFNATGFSASDYVEMRLKRDDGAVVYLNGVEVMRDGMPSGTINYNTLAAVTQGGASESTPVTQLIPATLLNDGSNTIAIEVHQADVTSSDITMDFELANVGPVGAASLLRGPYLQTLTQNSVIVKWRTNVPTTSMVRFGYVPGVQIDSAEDLTITTEHEVLVTGLTEGTTYYYSFGDGAGPIGGGDANHFFKTAPASDYTGMVRAWVLGDAGTANNDQRSVRDRYYSYAAPGETDMILMLGDNAYNDGTDAQYQNAMFQNMYEDILRQAVVWSCPGNHDLYSASSASQTGPYYDIFSFPTAGEAGGIASGTEAYYSWDYGQVHFISLDSDDSPRNLGGSMLTWLENDLAANLKPWVVVIFHHPPYTKGSHDSDNNNDSGGRMRDMRENVLPLLESYGVDLVLSGHSHSYERSYFLQGHYGTSNTFNNNMKVQDGGGQLDVDCSYKKTSVAGEGSVYITAGSSGKVTGTLTAHPAMYAYLYQLGSVIVEVENNRMDVKFLNGNGVISDYFTIDKDVRNASIDTTIELGSSIDLTASWSSGFSWNNGGATTKTITVSPNADIQYIVTDPNGCLADTFNITVVQNCQQQTIAINEGWNMISGYIQPDNPDMLAVFSSISSSVDIVKNSIGQVASPSASFNFIGNWNPIKAYLVKANAAASLVMGCTAINPDVTSIPLLAGWDFIAYLRNTPMDAAVALAGISSDIILVKDVYGSVYFPQFSLNNIGDLIPGNGYQVKMLNAATLTYPSNTGRVAAGSFYTPPPSNETRFGEVGFTGNNATLLFPEESLQNIQRGDEIAVFNSRGALCGAAVFEGGHTALTVWGTDDPGADRAAMAAGEPFHVQVWPKHQGQPVPALVTYSSGDGTYARDGIFIAESVSLRNSALAEDPLIAIYPNPSKGMVYLSLNGLPASEETIAISISDLSGQVVDRRVVTAADQTLDLQELPPGSYIFRAAFGTKAIEKQLILMR